jgi:hypothetical protein
VEEAIALVRNEGQENNMLSSTAGGRFRFGLWAPQEISWWAILAAKLLHAEEFQGVVNAQSLRLSGQHGHFARPNRTLQ